MIACLGGDDAIEAGAGCGAGALLEGDGGEGVDADGVGDAASSMVAFSGAMVEISSVGPKSKSKLKLVSKVVLASLAAMERGAVFGLVVGGEAEVEVRGVGLGGVGGDAGLRSETWGTRFCASGAMSVVRWASEVGAEHGAGVFDELAEVAESGEGAGGEEFLFDGAGDGVPGADAGGEGDALEGVHGGFADAARRGVDHAAESDGVVRILHELEVAEDVFDFGAVVEAEAADHVVLDLVAAESFFHETRLRVGAVEDGAARGFDGVVGAGGGFAKVFGDAVGDEEGFVFAVGGFVVADERAAFARGEEVLAFALRVLRDDGGGAFEDDLRGAVVLLEADGAGVGKIFFELEDVLDVGAAPGVDGLVFIADDADVAVGAEELHELVLGAVGVLVLVDEEIFVAAVVTLADFGWRT